MKTTMGGGGRRGEEKEEQENEEVEEERGEEREGGGGGGSLGEPSISPGTVAGLGLSPSWQRPGAIQAATPASDDPVWIQPRQPPALTLP